MDINKTLKDHFGYDQFRGRQDEIIKHVMSGQNALVIMPTGMGKSLCYQIPALLSEDLTLVISPLIALMQDQVESLVTRNIEATFINSSLSGRERKNRYKQVHDGQFKLLYVTPERFRKSEFLAALKKRTVSLLAIDEAHCISEWGHDFRPDYSRLQEFRALVNDPVTLALTATATPEVQDDIRKQLGLDFQSMKLFDEGIDRPNLSLEVVESWSEEGKIKDIERIIEAHKGPGIVYFTLIKTLDRFSELLHRNKRDHVCYHGQLAGWERREIQDEFMNGDCQLVLATNAFGMGIDKENIRFVIHAELPSSMESYYQEIGRAGRDGKASVCTFLYDQEDLMTQMQFLEWANPSPDYYRQLLQILECEQEKLQAFGYDWLQKQVHPRGRHDHRLETALGMLDRFNVIEGETNRYNFKVNTLGPLPNKLTDEARHEKKLKHAQQKLYTLVQYVKNTGDRKAFINQYFGIQKVEE
jgi:ATP-dependent DNA helicase RecQ